jgi:hypothetical protein
MKKILKNFFQGSRFLLLLTNNETLKYRLKLYILFLFFSSNILAQYYDTGQDPASIKWMQIKTGKFTVIYPESYGIEGVKFAKSFDDSYTKLTSLYSVSNIHIPVLIHNYTTYSNGYVAWAPKRVEIYPTPDPNGIPEDPIEQLTTHELTHVLQMVSLNRGFSKVMSVLTGEQFTGAISVLLPLWFMEGDAVFAESLLSPSGRGRAPSFQKEMKSITLENQKMFSYDKILAGSLKDFVPDHYQYGYQMVAWSFARYGPQLWNKALDFTGKNPFTLNPVNLSLERNAGITKAKLFSETFDSLKIIWKREELKINPINYEALNPFKKRDYVNYYSPVSTGKDSVIAIKTSFKRSPEFVLINPHDRSKKRIHIPGDMDPYCISGSKDMIVWVENQPDPRWENRTYSVIKTMDLHRKTIRQLSFKSRYLAVSISPDGKFIAATENTVNNENSLVILNASNGTVLNRIPVPGNAFPQRPQWSQPGDEISIISLSEKGEGIMLYSLKNHSWNILIDPGRDDLQSAFLRNDSLFFVSSTSGTDNIYLLTSDKRVEKLTNSKYGAYDLSPVSGRLLFSEYTSSGYNICEVNIKDSEPYSVSTSKNPSFLINRFDTIKIRSANHSLKEYKPEPYRKWSHLFNFHSWMPFYADIEKIQSDPASVRPGFTLMSQNQLSTVISTIGYEYAPDKTNQIHAKVTLEGWLPVIESQLDYGEHAAISTMGSRVGEPSAIQPGLHFTNSISVPLTYSYGRFSQYIKPSLSAEYANDYVYISENKKYDYGQTLISGRLYFDNYTMPAIRDIYPRWAQVFDINYTYAPFDKNIYGSISTLKTAFYFPGLLPNHGLRLRYETEIQNPQMMIYYNRASLPRSYEDSVFEKINFLSADYVMPLIYPDLNVPGLIFIQRIRSSFFYDYALVSKNHYLDFNRFYTYHDTFRSFGVELMADFYLLRIPFLISSGIQTTWRTINSPPYFELLFNIDIFGMKVGRRRL